MVLDFNKMKFHFYKCNPYEIFDKSNPFVYFCDCSKRLLEFK